MNLIDDCVLVPACFGLQWQPFSSRRISGHNAVRASTRITIQQALRAAAKSRPLMEQSVRRATQGFCTLRSVF
jgi:hypothetical protein